MTKEDIIRKLCSRRFWLAIAGFIAMLIIFFNGSEETATQVVALVMAGGTIIAYIIGEGWVDAESETTNIEEATYNYTDGSSTSTFSNDSADHAYINNNEEAE